VAPLLVAHRWFGSRRGMGGEPIAPVDLVPQRCQRCGAGDGHRGSEEPGHHVRSRDRLGMLAAGVDPAANAIGVVVLTNSHGGNADAGYCVGELIRQRRLATVIRGSCNSSCSRMWLGGVSRTLDGANSRVVLHSNYDSNGNLRPGAPARLRAWLPNYAQVNRELMEQWINLPENKQLMYFYNDRAELCDHGRCTSLPGWNARDAGLSTQ
jgi:hypothetical protein